MSIFGLWSLFDNIVTKIIINAQFDKYIITAIPGITMLLGINPDVMMVLF